MCILSLEYSSSYIYGSNFRVPFLIKGIITLLFLFEYIDFDLLIFLEDLLLVTVVDERLLILLRVVFFSIIRMLFKSRKVPKKRFYFLFLQKGKDLNTESNSWISLSVTILFFKNGKVSVINNSFSTRSLF